MHEIFTADQAKQTDDYTITDIGIPSMVLMERAAAGVTKRVLKVLDGDKERPVICICGKGNNGGDGLCVARQLSERGVNVSIFLCSSSEDRNNDKETDYDRQLYICRKINIRFIRRLQIPLGCIVVDAIFGNGLDREVVGVYAEIIKKLNASRAYVISVDMPSGINASTGQIMGCAVRADETVTFGAERLGHILQPGCEYTGTLNIEKIGWQSVEAEPRDTGFYLLDEEELKCIPARSSYSHKGMFGNVLIIAGSKEYGGAVILSSLGAFFCGAGLVRVYTHEDNREPLLSRLAEAIVTDYDKGDFKPENADSTLERLEKLIKSADSIVVGPGMGTGEISARIVSLVFKKAACHVIADADALNLISQKKAEPAKKRKKNFSLTLTPHIKEASRLLEKSVDEIKADLPGSCKALCKLYDANVILKGAVTVMSDGKDMFFNKGANSGMACAGSGDVLSGMLGALAGLGLKGSELMRAGVYLHSRAGEAARKKFGEAGMLPSDVAYCVRDVIKS